MVCKSIYTPFLAARCKRQLNQCIVVIFCYICFSFSLFFSYRCKCNQLSGKACLQNDVLLVRWDVKCVILIVFGIDTVTAVVILCAVSQVDEHFPHFFAYLVLGTVQAGPASRPAAAIVNSPVPARARVLCDGLGCRWLVGNYKSDGCASWKSITKLLQKSILREFAKASEAEIWTHVRRRYLTFFAGLYFEN